MPSAPFSCSSSGIVTEFSTTSAPAPMYWAETATWGGTSGGNCAIGSAASPHPEAIALWQNFESFGGERPPEFLSTHPAPGSRIQNLQELLPEAMPIYEANRQKQ
jgi:Zn-dependent protease with chaperone function